MLINKNTEKEIQKSTTDKTHPNAKPDSLKDFYENEDYDNLINYLKISKLETIGQTSILTKLFSVLDRKKLYNKMVEILIIIAKYKINVFDYELKEGIRTLIQIKKLEEALQILNILIENEKIIDEYVVTSLISSCFATVDQTLLENCFNLVVSYYALNKNISHTFWQTSIEGLLKIKRNDFAEKLLKMYPIKYSYSESLWRNVIISNMNDDSIINLFELFDEKYESRTKEDEFRVFENIYNIFIEEMAMNS
jgi:hypothetical protein